MYLMMRIRYFLSDGINYAIILAVLIGGIVLSGVYFLRVNQTASIEEEKFNSVYAQYNQQKHELENKNKSYLENSFMSITNNEKFIELTRAKFTYSMNINGSRISSSTFDNNLSNNESSKSYKINKSYIEIELLENYGQTLSNVLPQKIISCASTLMIDNPSSIIDIDCKPSELSVKKQETANGCKLIYRIDKISPDEIITLEILPLLSKKLDIGSTKIEIIYNTEG